jgi:hypothetical protein
MQLQVPDAGSVDTDLRMLAWAVQVARYAPQVGVDHHDAHRAANTGEIGGNTEAAGSLTPPGG